MTQIHDVAYLGFYIRGGGWLAGGSNFFFKENCVIIAWYNTTRSYVARGNVGVVKYHAFARGCVARNNYA